MRLRPKIPPAARLAVTRRIVDGPLGVRYLSRRAPMRLLLTSPDSDVYVDGFPRCANSYAFYGFRLANQDARVSGHCHSAAAVRRALDLGVPTLLLVREPRECVASFVQFVPGLSIDEALGHYRRFHRRVLALEGEIQVAAFADVTADLGQVIRNLNASAGTTFAPYVGNEENEAAVQSILRATNTRFASGTEATIAAPSASRLGADDVLGDIDGRRRRRLAECHDLYELLLAR